MKAFYDPVRDEIVGAVPGSYAWFHESRHREQYRSGWAERVDILHMYCYYVSFFAGFGGLLFVGVLGWLLGVGFAMSPHVFALFLLELDAYVVGSFRWFRAR